MKPKVVIESEIYRKIMHWVNKSHYEVSGLGTCKFDPKTSEFRVISAMLLPQRNTTTHTDIKPEDVCKAMYELRDVEGELKFWWHSHVEMAVFWSGEDMSTIRDIGQGGWVLASVFNKKREIRSAFYGVGGLIPTWHDQLDTTVTEFREPKADEWDEEYKKNVTNQVFQPSLYPMYGRQTEGWEYRNGVYVRTTETTKASSGTTTTAGQGREAGDQSDEIPSEEEYSFFEPPLKRPPGMPKRDFKRWKKDWNAAQLASQEVREAHLARVATRDELNDDDGGEDDDILRCWVTGQAIDEEKDFVSPYPFTQAELSIIAQSGWDTKDLDFLLANDFDRNDILQGLEFGYTPSDLVAEEENDDDETDDDDVPVMDRRHTRGLN